MIFQKQRLGRPECNSGLSKTTGTVRAHIRFHNKTSHYKTGTMCQPAITAEYHERRMQEQLPCATARLVRRCYYERREAFALLARRERLRFRPRERGFPARYARPGLHPGPPAVRVLSIFTTTKGTKTHEKNIHSRNSDGIVKDNRKLSEHTYDSITT